MDPDYKSVDSMHIFRAILSRDLPPERIGGIINLVLTTRPSATIDEIEDSLVFYVPFSIDLNRKRIFQHVMFFRDMCTVQDHMLKFPTFHRYVS